MVYHTDHTFHTKLWFIVNEKSCILIFSNFVLILFFLKKQAVLSNLFCKRKKEKKKEKKSKLWNKEAL